MLRNERDSSMFHTRNKIPLKRELAKKWLRNIGANHTVAIFNFNRMTTILPWTASRLIWSTDYFEFTERRRLLKEDFPTSFMRYVRRSMAAVGGRCVTGYSESEISPIRFGLCAFRA